MCTSSRTSRSTKDWAEFFLSCAGTFRMPDRWIFRSASSKKPSPWPRVFVVKQRLTDKLRRRIYLHEQRADRMCRDSDYSLATSHDSLFYAGGSLALLSARSTCRDRITSGFEANWRYCAAPGARSPIMTVISTRTVSFVATVNSCAFTPRRFRTRFSTSRT